MLHKGSSVYLCFIFLECNDCDDCVVYMCTAGGI